MEFPLQLLMVREIGGTRPKDRFGFGYQFLFPILVLIGMKSNCSAISARVRSARTAAKATFGLF
ncbi:MAG: hypothetical protein KC587_16130 [Nitrospira sp.]|nr:hypothetical protein [Nitrospira sp.]